MTTVEIIGHNLRYPLGTKVNIEKWKADSLVKAGVAKIVGSKAVQDDEKPLKKKEK